MSAIIFVRNGLVESVIGDGRVLVIDYDADIPDWIKFPEQFYATREWTESLIDALRFGEVTDEGYLLTFDGQEGELNDYGLFVGGENVLG